jgi:hypothetical protein
MPFLAALASAVAQATHTVSKALDDAADIGGGLPFVKAITGIASGVAGLGAGREAQVERAEVASVGFVERARSILGFSPGVEEISAQAEPIKLGRSAHHYNPSVTVAEAPRSQFEFSLQDLIVQADLPSLKGAGMGVSAANI